MVSRTASSCPVSPPLHHSLSFSLIMSLLPFASHPVSLLQQGGRPRSCGLVAPRRRRLQHGGQASNGVLRRAAAGLAAARGSRAAAALAHGSGRGAAWAWCGIDGSSSAARGGAGPWLRRPEHGADLAAWATGSGGLAWCGSDGAASSFVPPPALPRAHGGGRGQGPLQRTRAGGGARSSSPRRRDELRAAAGGARRARA